MNKIFEENRVLLADSYKYSQPMQYRNNASYMYDYMEARGGEYPATVFFGLQYILMRYFSKPITAEEVQEANDFITAHGEPFDYDGWMYIVNEHKGKLPVRIKAVKEGSLVPISMPLITIDSTDPKVFWIVGWFETFLMKVWYPTTIATKSFYVKQMLIEIMDEYSDTSFVDFMFHNFGDRGSSSVEAAGIGAVAHLTQFKGTDNANSLRYARHFYDSQMAGFSIPASEHSTVTSWGKFSEFNMIDNYLEVFKSSPIIACVLDSYDIYNAVDKVTSGTFKQKIESPDYPILVMRPDSGEPVEVVIRILSICDANEVQYTLNSKGLKVMNKYRIIYGDGISPKVIRDILIAGIKAGYAPDNFAFGSGGDLMQNVNRDTCKFAIKCSYMEFNDGTSIDVYKDPITDKGKTSKKGKVSSYKNNLTGEIICSTTDNVPENFVEILDVVFENGDLKRSQTLDDIREISNKGI